MKKHDKASRMGESFVLEEFTNDGSLFAFVFQLSGWICKPTIMRIVKEKYPIFSDKDLNSLMARTEVRVGKSGKFGM
jgi:hypothetical protein